MGLFGVVVLVIVGVAIVSQLSSNGGGGPPPDTTPPSFKDPFKSCNGKGLYDLGTRTALEPISRFWKHPTATDKHGPPIITTPYLPRTFGEGIHEFTYQAADKSPHKNVRTCRVRFNVVINKCEELSSPLNGYHNCPINQKLKYGTRCQYNCHTGYKLKPSSRTVLTCGLKPMTQNQVKWSDEPPICSEIVCEALSDPERGSIACTNSNKYHSTCIFSCETGHGIPHGNPETVVCLNGLWSGRVTTQCTDVERPTFLDCRRPIVETLVLNPNETASVVNWTIPAASDNSGIEPTVIVPSWPQPGDELSPGIYPLTYRATDLAGNEGTCDIIIRVREIFCPPLPIQAGLRATCSHGTRRGSFCHFSCGVGYALHGNNTAVCEKQSNSGEWSNIIPSCQELHCPSPPSVANGNHGTCKTTHGSSCFYECSEGYTITSSVLQCVADPAASSAEWVGEEPVCREQTCDRPPLHNMLEVKENTTCSSSPYIPYKNTCEFSCVEGYVLKGDAVTQCGSKGFWLEPTPECDVITCKTPPKPWHGGISGCPTQIVRYGTSCTLFCNAGYQPATPVTTTCLSDSQHQGYWDGGVHLACSIVQCDPLAGPLNGFIDSCEREGSSTNVTHRQEYNSVCTSSCLHGYTEQHSVTRRCLADGLWDGVDQVCLDITPPRLTCPSDQVVYADIRDIVGIFNPKKWEHSITAEDAGMSLIPHLYQVDGDVVISGGIPTTLEEGDHHIVYQATDLANNSVSCSFNLEVKVTKCSALFTPENGALTLDIGDGACEGGTVYGSECFVTCQSGYELSKVTDIDEATFTLTCNRSSETASLGFWSDTTPQCNKIQCDIPDVTQGSVFGCPTSAAYGDECDFRCDDGFISSEGMQSVSRICQANGMFDSTELHCDVQVTCPSLDPPANGVVAPAACSDPDGVAYDTLCSFTCDNGFLQNGVYQKTCLSSGQWNDRREVLCRDKQAPVFDTPCPININYNAENGTSYSVVDVEEPTVTDNSGNATVKLLSALPEGSKFPEGPTRLTFRAIDQEGNLAYCVIQVQVTVFRCIRPPAPSHGTISNCTTSPVYGAQCVFACHEGYELEGSQILTCEHDGGQAPAYWDQDQPFCQAKTCPALETPPNAVKSVCTQEPPDTETYGTQCVFYCSYGFEGQGESSPRCQADGTWTSNNFTCVATSCSALDTPEGGVINPAQCTSNPAFGQSCVVTCMQEGFQLHPSTHAVVSCQGNGQWTPGNLDEVICQDIEAPVFVECPSSLAFYASRGSVLAEIGWNVSASDNSGVVPNITCDTAMGAVQEGDFSVACTARDDEGNERRCAFDVAVEVRRCRPYLLPAHSSLKESCETVWGTECQVTCDAGHRLIGSGLIMCEYDGNSMDWYAAETPSCTVIQCDELWLPENVMVNPTYCTGAGPVDQGIICTPFCSAGLTLVGDGSVVTCFEDGQWSRLTNSSADTGCFDVTPPTLYSCPSPITVSRTETWGVEVQFPEPTAADAIDDDLDIVTSPSDLTSPYNVTGDAVFTYMFIDDEGNSVTCQFNVYVQDEIAPKVLSCPNDTEITSSQDPTEVTWEQPEFEGDSLSIDCLYDSNTASLSLGKDHLISCTATNLDNGKAATCAFTISMLRIPCLDLHVPINGALTCDGWSQGKFCSVFCDSGHDIPRTVPEVPAQYVCGNSGQWTPNANVPDCTSSRSPRRSVLQSSLQYFSGSCGDNGTAEAIAKAFLDLFSQSAYSSSCAQTDQCTVSNVQVTCGLASRKRRRRSLNMRRSFEVSPQRRKRQTAFVYTVNFNVESSLPDETDFDTVVDVETNVINLLETLISDDVLELGDSVDGINLVVDDQSLSYGLAEIICSPPYTANNKEYRCVPCGPGYYYENSTQACELCERGTYQNGTARFSCDACPAGKSTMSTGSRNETECIDMCAPGSYSSTGLVPCYTCVLGEYQSEYFSTNCSECPEGMTTRSRGSNSSSQCEETCSAGESSPSGFAPCTPCPVATYQPASQQTKCVKCPGNTTTLQNGTVESAACVEIDECDSQPCQHGGTCIDGHEAYTCVCQQGYTGPSCSIETDECSPDPCFYGDCVDGQNEFTCVCFIGYTGEVCETQINYCALLAPCKNNATCSPVLGDYRCECSFGWGGKNCSEAIDYCAGDPCKNGALCAVSELAVSGYQCQCVEGYHGVNCSMDIDDCKNDPCLNRGQCIDTINNFTCVCPSGFKGHRCDIDIDLCADVICLNDGTCQDLGEEAVCACLPEYAGPVCGEWRTACSDDPCNNGGTCEIAGDSSLEFTCSCPIGYIGQTCETRQDFCQSDPCQNDASCTDADEGFYCTCTVGFTGNVCEETISWCSLDDPCGPNAICIDETEAFRCVCDFGWTGELCQEALSLCDTQDPCLNGATCSGDQTSFQCHCPLGYHGDSCELEINNCTSSPCLNGATCVKEVLSYHCLCPAGYTGDNCGENIDECLSNPCEHGVCLDGIDSFQCECERGYGGLNCSEDLLCSPNPCENQGVCDNQNTKWSCLCPDGFSGSTCQRNIDECRRARCVNAIGCEDGINSFTCICISGFTGTLCETEINECELPDPPCLNSGVCVNQWGSFACQCQQGYSGDLCEINIDDCEGNACENGATCIDGVNTYSCQCVEGSFGSYCQLKSTPCDNNPCLNGGLCQFAELDSFTCECLSGLTGDTCETNIDDCINHQCSSGSTCEDQLNGYRCSCPLGVTGQLCDAEIDDCASDPCYHGATCADGTASFTCRCSEGFSGRLCDIDILECASNPCANFGTCIEGTDRYDCICDEGYTGPTCEEIISSCESNPCKHNASCIDGVKQFVCVCAPGYYGETCEAVIPANFDLRLDSQTPTIPVSAQHAPNASNLAISFWVAVSTGSSSSKQLLQVTMGNLSLALTDPCNLTLVKLGQLEVMGSLTSSLCGGDWHHVLIVVDASGKTIVHVDGAALSTSRPPDVQFEFTGNAELVLGDAHLQQNDWIQLTSLNIWSGYVPEDLLSVDARCQPQELGNVISWTDFDSLDSFTSVTPSQCDDTNECLATSESPPCENGGTCVDDLHKFRCLCPADYTGTRCETIIELCGNQSCENGGACVTSNQTTQCSCVQGFLGEFCEITIVNGGWSEWSKWTICTEECEGGTQNRTRDCSNPPPNDYGEACTGEDIQVQICNTGVCPGCLELHPPANGTMDCWKDDEMKRCTIQCASDDYDFVGAVEPEYSCGPESGYRWTHESPINRRAVFPPCKESKQPEAIQASGTLTYPDATCESEADRQALIDSFTSTYSNNAQNFGCNEPSACSVSRVEVNNCDGGRRKRVAEVEPLSLTIDLVFNYTTEAAANTSDLLPYSQVSVMLDQLLQDDAFSLTVGGQVFGLDYNASSGSVNVTCPYGSGITSQGGCTLCPAGTYQYISVDDGLPLCIPCLLNTYQPQEGQVECIACPDGLITKDYSSEALSDCITQCPLGTYRKFWADGEDETTCFPCPLDTYQNETGKESCYGCPDGYVTLESASTNITDCVAVCSAGYYVDMSNKTDPQCHPCPRSTYLESESSVHTEEECTPCPEGLVTLQNGSDNSTDCVVICSVGSFLQDSLDCIPCPIGTYQNLSEHQLSSCVQCPGGFTTLNDGSISVEYCKDPESLIPIDDTPTTSGRDNTALYAGIATVVILLLSVVVVTTIIYLIKKTNHVKRSVTPEPLEMVEGVSGENLYTQGPSERNRYDEYTDDAEIYQGSKEACVDDPDQDGPVPYCRTPVEKFNDDQQE